MRSIYTIVANLAFRSTTSRYFFVVVALVARRPLLYPPPTSSPSVHPLYWSYNGPLHSFCPRGSCHYNIRCWPVYYCRSGSEPCRPNIPSNTTCQHEFPLLADCMVSISLPIFVPPPSDLYTTQPYKAITGQYARGTQVGYNQCNSSTENQQSMCQTIIINDITGAFDSKLPRLVD